MKTIEAACPKCKKHFPIELPDGPRFSIVAACDHCDHKKRVSVFVKELERQRRIPGERDQEQQRILAKVEKQKVKAARKKEAKEAKAEVKKTKALIKQQQEQQQEQLKQQEDQADLARFNSGVGCPRCGSLRSKTVKKSTGGVIQAVGLFLMVIGLVMCLVVVGMCFGLPTIFFGFILLILGCCQNETKLHCLKCGFRR
ncbi:MAG: hypothetical protein ACXAC5_01935 [Promethearchaeota archaeon]|jgi:preprotein translocase subunit SecF